jgi:hypothetical protein
VASWHDSRRTNGHASVRLTLTRLGLIGTVVGLIIITGWAGRELLG